MQDNRAQVTQRRESAPAKRPKRAIEESFPIVEINRLAIPERNAFKPIYQMHKWFARRASSVFRAILLGALKPAGTDIMEEFYKDHTHDPDTNGKVILDPFMGGGTTVVEALRLGCKVIGIDLNPVAWFIVKTEVEPVELDELKAAFERLANRKTSSGRTVREELLSHYKTRCPACGNEDAEIIYVFWVKSAICTNPECKKQVPLFSDYLVAQKSPSIRFFSDAGCPHASCGKTFDWEIEPVAMVGEEQLMLTSARDGAGEGRGNRRWTYSPPDSAARCPWCEKNIIPKARSAKPARKKIRISVFYCPRCASVFQYRGTPPEEIGCPGCLNSFQWGKGNVPDKGKFHCPHCGQGDAIIESIRRLPQDQLFPTRMYALEGHCCMCGEDGDGNGDEDDQRVFSEGIGTSKRKTVDGSRKPMGFLWKNKGKFFKAVQPTDEKRFQDSCARWQREKQRLPYPSQRILEGYNTGQMIEYHYRFWQQMYNPRQLLCLSTLLQAISEENEQSYEEMLLSAFQYLLERNNMFCRYYNDRNTIQGLFSGHYFQPKNTPAEGNVFGPDWVRGTFSNLFQRVVDGKKFCLRPFDHCEEARNKSKVIYSNERLLSEDARVECADSQITIADSGVTFDCVITDPPYVGNVHYGEMADLFYVWLRLPLKDTYQQFHPEFSPKAAEIEVNSSSGKTAADFREGLTRAFTICEQRLRDDGLMVFTFHHRENEAWESVLGALCEAGFELVDAYPIHGEKETALLLQETSAISYDLIHVCRKRDPLATGEKRAWATIKPEIRREARKEIERIEGGVFGSSKSLSPADKLIVLTGKCLQLYSRHYNAVVDHTGRVVPLKEALEDIRMLVDLLVSKERPLPGELEDIDRPSYIYLTALSEKKEIKSDDVHKATRGIIEIEELLEAGLMKRGRAGRGRTYEVKTPSDRFSTLLEKFEDESSVSQSQLFDEQASTPSDGNSLFIDRLHFLIALAEGKENLKPWIERWRGEIPQIRAACEYLLERRKDFTPALKKILTMIDVGSLGLK